MNDESCKSIRIKYGYLKYTSYAQIMDLSALVGNLNVEKYAE